MFISLFKQLVSIIIDLLKFPLPPNTLLLNRTVTIIKLTFTMLLAVQPLTFIAFFADKGKDAKTVLFSLWVLSLIKWSIRPNKFTFPMKLSILPLSFIIGVVRILGLSKSMRNEQFQINFALILSSFLIHYSRLILRIVVKKNGKGQKRVIRIVNY